MKRGIQPIAEAINLRQMVGDTQPTSCWLYCCQKYALGGRTQLAMPKGQGSDTRCPGAVHVGGNTVFDYATAMIALCGRKITPVLL
jgi:hypothetical protein